jgi:hypothetical protein
MVTPGCSTTDHVTSSRWSRGVVLALVTIAIGSPAGAQSGTTVSVDVGGSQVTQSGGWSATALNVSPGLRVDGQSTLLLAGGSFSQFDGAWSTQGSALGSVFTSLARPTGLELLGAASGTRHQFGVSTAEGRALARLHARRTDMGLWIGGGAGTAYDGDSTHVLQLLDGGVWFSVARALAAVGVSPIRLSNERRYTTAELSIWVPLKSMDISLTGGMNSGNRDRAESIPRSWGSASAVFWLGRSAGIAVAGGRYAPTPTQGTPGGTFLTAALRLANRRPYTPPDPGGAVPAGRAPAALAVTDFSATTAAGSTTIRIRAPGARLVEVSADFTQWEPVRLASAGDDWWVLTMPIRPGTYEINVRVDGGRWLVPPGTTVVHDRVGGASGRLVIPATM